MQEAGLISTADPVEGAVTTNVLVLVVVPLAGAVSNPVELVVVVPLGGRDVDSMAVLPPQPMRVRARTMSARTVG